MNFQRRQAAASAAELNSAVSLAGAPAILAILLALTLRR